MFYNAKSVSGYERIGMAVSRDMKNLACATARSR